MLALILAVTISSFMTAAMIAAQSRDDFEKADNSYGLYARDHGPERIRHLEREVFGNEWEEPTDDPNEIEDY